MAQENKVLEPVKMGSTGLDQLSKNLEDLESVRSDNDIGEQLAKNWKNIVWAIILAVGLGIAWDTLKEGQARSKGASSERFEALQRDFHSLVVKGPEMTPELEANTKRAFEDNLKAIKEIDSRSFYASLGELYEVTSLLKSGNAANALEKLKPFELTQLTPKIDSENLLIEQALLLKAKAYLATSEGKESGKQLLRGLALQGKVVQGEALLSYIRVFGADQELVNATLLKNPGLREILRSELKTLGVTIDD